VVSRSRRPANGLRRRAAEQLVLVGLVVDAVEIRTPDDLARVQEYDALTFRHFAVTLAEKNGLFPAALEHFRFPQPTIPPQITAIGKPASIAIQPAQLFLRR
jgi:hypothetical protein